MKIPNFFIVGAQKCGTTALSEYLRHHPNVYFSDPKELDFFTHEDTRALVNGVHLISSVEDYLEYFRGANENHLAVGEGSPKYVRSETAIPNILDLNPEARLIAMVRNPVNLLYSLHGALLLGNREVIQDFEEAWRMQEERREGRSIPRFCADMADLFYAETGMLGKQVKRLLYTAPAEQVKVIVFDDFVQGPQRIYEEVLSFLELPGDGRTEFPQIGTSKRAVRSRFFHLGLLHAKNRVARAKRTLGIRGGLGILEWLSKDLNTRLQPRPPLSASFEAELRDFYREDVELLSQLLDRDLSPWLRGESIAEGATRSQQ